MKYFFTLLIILILCFKIQASHIVGGDFSLKKLNDDESNYKYLLNFKVFRDCEFGVPYFNDPVYVGMFERETHKLVDTIIIDLLSDDTLIFVGDNCINIPDGCTHIGYYEKVITLDPNIFDSEIGYYFSWERCCRNVSTVNIYRTNTNPNGSEGIAFYMEIPPLKIQNSTPVFQKDPLTLLCVDNPFKFDYNVYDPDGDSLVFSLIPPIKGNLTYLNMNHPGQISYPLIYSGPYENIIWESSYHVNYKIDGNPTLEIDPHTGVLTITPLRQGIYAVAIKVREYRDGEFLGYIVRELQFTISSCHTNTPPHISESVKDTIYEFYATDRINIPIEIADPNRKDSIYLSYEGEIFEGHPETPLPFANITPLEGIADINASLRWNTHCGHIREKPYEVNLEVIDNGCPRPMIDKSSFYIQINQPPVVPPPRQFCLERINENSIGIYWGYLEGPYEYFSHFILYRQTEDTLEVLKIFEDTLQNYFADHQAYNNVTENNYCYFMKSVNKCGKLSDITNIVCSKYDTTWMPPRINIHTATVVDNKNIKVIWDKDPSVDFKSYQIYRKRNFSDDPFQLYHRETNSEVTSFIDKKADVHKISYCYKVLSNNLCGYFSPETNKGCQIVLQGESQSYEHELKWNSFEFWESGTGLVTLKRKFALFDEDYSSKMNFKSDVISNYNDNELPYPEGGWWYKVVAYEGFGGNNAESHSNEIFLYQKPLVYIPNSFSPNKDDINEEWGIKTIYVKDFHLQVYSRWGQLVFETFDKEVQWDGKLPNEQLSEETVFIYQIRYTGWDESLHYTNGNVTVIR